MMQRRNFRFTAIYFLIAIAKGQYMAGPHEDVDTSFYLPNVIDDKIPIGKPTTILCHLVNDSPTPFNVTAIQGTMTHPLNFRMSIQNFTHKSPGVVVKPGEEITLSYEFEVHKNLEPAEYVITHTVYYNFNNRQYFSSTFYNHTVEIVHIASEYDLESVLAVLGAIMFTIFVILATIYFCAPSKAEELFKSVKAKKSASTSDSWDVDNTPKSDRKLRDRSSTGKAAGTKKEKSR